MEDRLASNLVTAAQLLEASDVEAVLAFPGAAEAGLSAAGGDVAGRLLRINHTGQRAVLDAVLTSVLTLGLALKTLGRAVDLEAATDAITGRYTDADRRAAPGH